MVGLIYANNQQSINYETQLSLRFAQIIAE